jgi:uncharacterized phage protein (TIGR02220 family)
MQNGNWVPISKFFSYALPRKRVFTDLEAMYSLQLDYDNDNTITILGCSRRWGWSRTKVTNFLIEHDIIISYPDELKSIRKKRGCIDIHPDKKRHKKKHKEDNKETIKEHKRFIDSKWIADSEDNKKAIKRHKKNNEKVTTIDPNNNPNPNKENIYTIVNFLNEKLGTKFKPNSKKTKSCINARLNEGYSIDDFKTVINKKYDSWINTEHAKYLRPETLFGNKFDGYLNEIQISKKTTNINSEKSLDQLIEEDRSGIFDFELKDFEDVT